MDKTQRALIVDDEPDIRELLAITLGRMGIHATTVESVAEALKLLRERPFHICLTDMRLPDGDGLDLVRFIQQHVPDLPVAVITAHGNMETAIRALKLGAFDFLSKPVDLEALRHLVGSAMRLATETLPPSPTAGGPPRLLGESPQILELRRLVNKVARSQAPIYISGESGTGKELVARMIHEQGPRAREPFIPVNCAAIPHDLMESEFFGHRKGSFTGAVSDKPGLFRAADGGTLFLDEVADLPLHMQVKLLRVIQEKRVRSVGDTAEQAVDVRILCATHKDLAQLVHEGTFRQDLYYRIVVIEIAVPPLRERLDDLPLLVTHILTGLRGQGLPQPRISPEAMTALQGHPFPGNVRELENILERALTLSDGVFIAAEDLRLPQGSATPPSPPPPNTSPEAVMPAPGTTAPFGFTTAPTQSDLAKDALAKNDLAKGDLAKNDLGELLDTVERRQILDALERTRWNKTAAAKLLGLSLRALRYRLEKLNIE
jgi:two-component system response regulator PilR (NtrC family)